MQLDRRNFLSLLIQSEPGKPAIANGVRAAVGFGIPLIVGQLIEQRENGLLVGLIAYFVNLTNVDGSYHLKAKAMLAATVGIALSVLAGLLVGNIPVQAVILTFCWGLACGFAPLYGNASDKVSLVIGLSFLFAIGHPSNLNVALAQSLLCLLAGGWAMLLSLAMWPLRPDRLCRFAVAACFEALAQLTTEIANYLQTEEAEAASTERIVGVRTALETARTYLGTTRIGQSATSWLEEQLLVAIQDADRLFGSTIALAELIENYAQHQQDRSVQTLVADALTQISIVLQSIAKVIAGKSASSDLEPLDRIYAALRAREQHYRRSSDRSDPAYINFATLSNLVLTIDKSIQQLRYTADSVTLLSGSGAARPQQRDVDLQQWSAAPRWTATEATPTPLSLLRDNFTLDSAICRHALRLSISLSIGVIIYSTTHLLMGYWVTLTTMLVLKPNLGMTFQRFFQRVGGTLLGALVATLLLFAIASKPILDMIIVLTVFFGVALIALNYGSSVVFTSIFILLLADLADVNDPMGWEFAGFRILNTCIGAGLAFGSHYLLLPNWESDRLPSQLATALRESQLYFSDVMAVYAGHRANDSTIIRQRRQTGLAIGNAQASFQGLLREPKLRQEVEPVMTLLVYLRRFTRAVTVLAVHLEHFGSIEPLPALATFDRQISLCLEQLADAVEQQMAPPQLPDLAAILESIKPHIQALRIARSQALTNAGQTPMQQAVSDYNILDLEIDQIVRRLTAMHSAIVRLKFG